MSRRGRCRCGTILLFERTEQGYKVRCTVCGMLVRLRSEDSKPPPTLVDRSLSATDFDVSDLEGLNPLAFQETSAPVAMVEMEVYHEPKARGGLWLLVGLALVGLALATGVIVLILNNPS